MTAADVRAVLEVIEGSSIWVAVAGGWGVDALVGYQTRAHEDLDISIRCEDGARTLDVLARSGFTVDVDWRPVRVAVRDLEGRQVDVHPLRFRPDGSAVQAGLDRASYDYPADAWTTGTIGGSRFACITAGQQMKFHLGYPLQQKDLDDMAALAATGLIAEDAYAS
jgi:lincosamide nucleotidyltransferase A/C/D/E